MSNVFAIATVTEAIVQVLSQIATLPFLRRPAEEWFFVVSGEQVTGEWQDSNIATTHTNKITSHR